MKLLNPFKPTQTTGCGEQLDRIALDWLQEAGVLRDRLSIEKFFAARFGDLSDRVYSKYADWQQIKLLHKWSAWLFVVDDEFDEKALKLNLDRAIALKQGCLDILKNQSLQLACSSFEALLFDFFCQLRRSKYYKLEREVLFISEIEKLFEGAIWQVQKNISQEIPTIEEYLDQRIKFSGVNTVIELCYLIDVFPIPANAEFAKKIADVANRIISIGNDIFSFKKERSTEFHNTVVLFQHHLGLNAEKALDSSIELYNNHVKDFINLKNFASTSDSYINCLELWISGSMDWHLISGRYQ